MDAISQQNNFNTNLNSSTTGGGSSASGSNNENEKLLKEMQEKIDFNRTRLQGNETNIKTLENEINKGGVWAKVSGHKAALRKELEADKQFRQTLLKQQTQLEQTLRQTQQMMSKGNTDEAQKYAKEREEQRKDSLKLGSDRYLGGLKEANGDMHNADVFLGRVETGMKVVRNTAVVVGATIATGGAAGAMMAAGYGTAAVAGGAIVAGTATGTTIGGLSNVAKATEEVLVYGRDAKEAFSEAGSQTLQDAKSSAIASVGTISGMGVAGKIAGQGASLGMKALAGSAAGGTNSVISTTIGVAEQAIRGEELTLKKVGKEYAVNMGVGMLSGGQGGTAGAIRESTKSSLAKAGLIGLEATGSMGIGLGGSYVKDGKISFESAVQEISSAVIGDVVGNVSTSGKGNKNQNISEVGGPVQDTRIKPPEPRRGARQTSASAADSESTTIHTLGNALSDDMTARMLYNGANISEDLQGLVSNIATSKFDSPANVFDQAAKNAGFESSTAARDALNDYLNSNELSHLAPELDSIMVRKPTRAESQNDNKLLREQHVEEAANEIGNLGLELDDMQLLGLDMQLKGNQEGGFNHFDPNDVQRIRREFLDRLDELAKLEPGKKDQIERTRDSVGGKFDLILRNGDIETSSSIVKIPESIESSQSYKKAQENGLTIEVDDGTFLSPKHAAVTIQHGESGPTTIVLSKDTAEALNNPNHPNHAKAVETFNEEIAHTHQKVIDGTRMSSDEYVARRAFQELTAESTASAKAGGPKKGDALREIKSLIDQGKHTEATALAKENGLKQTDVSGFLGDHKTQTDTGEVVQTSGRVAEDEAGTAVLDRTESKGRNGEPSKNGKASKPVVEEVPTAASKNGTNEAEILAAREKVREVCSEDELPENLFTAEGFNKMLKTTNSLGYGDEYRTLLRERMKTYASDLIDIKMLDFEGTLKIADDLGVADQFKESAYNRIVNELKNGNGSTTKLKGIAEKAGIGDRFPDAIVESGRVSVRDLQSAAKAKTAQAKANGTEIKSADPSKGRSSLPGKLINDPVKIKEGANELGYTSDHVHDTYDTTNDGALGATKNDVRVFDVRKGNNGRCISKYKLGEDQDTHGNKGVNGGGGTFKLLDKNYRRLATLDSNGMPTSVKEFAKANGDVADYIFNELGYKNETNLRKCLTSGKDANGKPLVDGIAYTDAEVDAITAKIKPGN